MKAIMFGFISILKIGARRREYLMKDKQGHRGCIDWEQVIQPL
jgi:hypothetical protein